MATPDDLLWKPESPTARAAVVAVACFLSLFFFGLALRAPDSPWVLIAVSATLVWVPTLSLLRNGVGR